MKKGILILHILFLPVFMLAQSSQLPANKVRWYSIEEAEQLAKKQPRPILVDMYTDWCGWCKRMDQTTFSDPQIINYLNTNFYPVKFNAETKDTITFLDKQYVNKSTGSRPTHELTYEFANSGRISYPSTLIMTSNFDRRMLIPGYLDTQKMLPFLIYYAEQAFMGTNIEQFREDFNQVFITPDTTVENKQKINWMSLKEATKMTGLNPKKMLIYMYYPGCVSCRMMDSLALRHPVITKFINKNYYPVRFDALSNDTIDFQGQQLINKPEEGPFHQLAIASMQQNMRFPAILFFNDKAQMVSPVPQYLTPDFMEAVLVFFYEEKFKDQEFQAFYQNFEGEIDKTKKEN